MSDQPHIIVGGERVPAKWIGDPADRILDLTDYSDVMVDLTEFVGKVGGAVGSGFEPAHVINFSGSSTTRGPILPLDTHFRIEYGRDGAGWRLGSTDDVHLDGTYQHFTRGNGS